MPTRQIFNARTQKVEEAELTVDQNSEVIATFKDGGIIKFPAGLTSAEFEKLIAKHQVANEGQEVITPEMEAEKVKERERSLKLIGDTTQESQSNDKTLAEPET